MVSGGMSNIGWQLNSRKRITGFGMRRRRVTGRGIVRRVIGSVARPALSFIANKVADLISGSGRRRRTVRRSRRVGGSYRITGSAYRRPRTRLVTRKRRIGCGRKPRRTLTIRRRRR